MNINLNNQGLGMNFKQMWFIYQQQASLLIR